VDIFFIGDSLIEYFDWQGRFPEKHVLNLGVAGETVEELLRRTALIASSHPAPDLVFIMTGTNNAAMEDFDFLASYRNILKALRAAYPGCKVFVHSLLPMLLDWVSQEAVQRVNRSIKEMAGEEGAGFIDLYAPFLKGREGLFLPDGVHLSERGYDLWAEEVEKAINPSERQ
jgi:lysophospholipase L1-like esterase